MSLPVPSKSTKLSSPIKDDDFGNTIRELPPNNQSFSHLRYGIIMEYNRAEMERLMDDLKGDVIKKTREQLSVDDINFTHELSKSVTADQIGDKHFVSINSPYARFVEFGTPAGKTVNFDALRIWVEGKLGVPRDESDIVTMKIMNKIKTKGIKPKRFFKKAIKAVISKRGILKTSNSATRSKRKIIGRREKLLNRAVKLAKKIKRFSRAINKHINKVNKVINATRKKR